MFTSLDGYMKFWWEDYQIYYNIIVFTSHQYILYPQKRHLRDAFDESFSGDPIPIGGVEQGGRG